MCNKVLGYNLLIRPRVQFYSYSGIEYNCTLGRINKLYLKTLLYIQPLY